MKIGITEFGKKRIDVEQSNRKNQNSHSKQKYLHPHFYKCGFQKQDPVWLLPTYCSENCHIYLHTFKAPLSEFLLTMSSACFLYTDSFLSGVSTAWLSYSFLFFIFTIMLVCAPLKYFGSYCQ